MATITLGELLEHACDFEQRLKAYYAEIRDRSQDNGVRLLTYYLVRHCRHQEQGLEHLDEEQMRRVRSVEFKGDLPFHPDSVFDMPNVPAETLAGNDLLDAAIAYDGKLIEWYERILRQPLTDEARSVLETLIRVEDRDLVMLKQMRVMNYF